MQGFKSQSAQKPTAMGSLLQSSAYGATIPKVIGQTQSPLLAIWAANLRQGGGVKKFKQFKKGITNYVENIDFLVGHSPMMGVLQIMVNGGLYPLNFTSMEFDEGLSSLVIDDPHFYFVIAVTASLNYSFDVDDYGGQGPKTLSGTYQVPLWNELEVGPDPTLPSSARNYPYNYRWEPGYGNTVYIDQNAIVFGLTVHYAQLMDATSFQPPLTKLGLAFEAQLGSGDEYAEAPSPFNAQQIIYPHFAGCGGAAIDLGASGTLPQLLPEVRGKWGIYPSGDADFVDMVEDIFKSGIAQAAIGAEPVFTQMESGLSCYDLPGCVQYKISSNNETFDPALVYNLPNTAGNFLVAIAAGAATTISDTAGNTWTPIFGGGLGFQVWWAKALGGGNTVSIPTLGGNWQIVLLEIAGVDTFDVTSFVTAAKSDSITTTNAPALPAYVLGVSLYSSGFSVPRNLTIPGWQNLTPENFYGFTAGNAFSAIGIQERTVRTPGTYELTIAEGTTPAGLCMLSFKAAQPVSYPRPLGDFLDLPSLDLVRAQCRANGLWGSLSMSSQSSASDWLKSIYQAANAAPVYLGSKLYSLPYSEVSTAGNGCTYTAPTAAGPVANLDADNGDFIGTDGCPKLVTGSRVGQPNVLQMQCVDRNSNYNQAVVQQPDAASIALYGERKADPIVNNAVQDPAIARALLGIQVRRNQYAGDSYTFTASARWTLLSPMDLITLTDREQGIVGWAGRITSYDEQEDGSFQGSAEPFVYGVNAPTPLSATSSIQNPIGTTVSAGDVNAPIIFEPVPRLYAIMPSAQLWLAVSSGAANYGGCQVYVSTDGGSSYNPLGDPLVGSAITGALTAGWPASTSPDTTNDLAVDLTESRGALQSFAVSDEDNFLYPCYVEGADVTVESDGTPVASLSDLFFASDGTTFAGPSLAFNYELMTYATAVLTSANKYTLKATGSGNHLNRAVFGAPGSAGVSHSIGMRFAFLSPAGTGILKVNMDEAWVGVELFFKIVSFNEFGAAPQSLSDVVAYSYTPTGVPSTV